MAAVIAICLGASPASEAAAPGWGPWMHDPTAPLPPSNLQASDQGSSSVTFTWDASSDDWRVAGYDVYVGSSTTPDEVSGLNYTVTGLACGTRVDIAVDAYDRAGNKSDPVTASGSTSACIDTQAPSAPAGLTVTARTDTTVTLGWSAASDDVGVVGYDVYQSGTLVGTTSSTSLAVDRLTCGTTYSFSVVARDAAGNTSAPTTASGTTADCAPPADTAPAPIAGMGYHQVFRDDFDTLDRSVWDDHIWYDESPSPSWTNFQYAQNGILHLATSRDFSCGTGCNYPINTITTQTSGLTYTQGYFEARMKWTGGDGAWPAFWLFSYRHATNNAYPAINPFCALNGLAPALCESGELDAFEGQGSEPQSFYGTIHSNSCGCYGFPDQQNDNNLDDAGTDLTQDFHTYGLLWTTSEIKWYLDGRLMHTAPVYDTTPQPMYLLLQMWSGGWTKGPDATTPDTLETQVDYVQVWQQ